MKLPELEHVKYVTAKDSGKVYAYFNTGKKKPDGRPIRTALPSPGSVGFYDSYASCLAARNRRGQTTYTVENLCDDFQASKTFERLAAGTRKAYGVYLRQIVTALGEFEVNDLDRGDIQLVLDGEEMGAGKQNLFVAVLGAAYKWGRSRNKTTLMPTTGIEKVETGERMPWPQEVLDAGLSAEDDRTRLAVALLFYTGQRIGDVCAMRWANVKRGAIHLVQQKTKKPLAIPLYSDLRAELDHYGKRGLTLLTAANGRPITQEALRQELKAFCAARGHPDLKPHGLRKNAVIALLTAGCSVAETSAITGQTYDLVQYYARQIDQEKMAGAAILKMEQRVDGKKAGKNSSQTRRKP